MNEVLSKAETVQHVWCSVAITKKMEDVFIAFIVSQATKAARIDEYIVYLSTLGGSAHSGMNLYNFMKSIPQRTTVYNMGNVHSAGVPFFLGFQRRFGVPDCSFMIHQTTFPRSILPEYFNVFDVETQQRSLLAIDKKSQEAILRETASRATKPLSADVIAKAALDSTTYGANEAHEHGFIEKIVSPKLPESGVLYLTDQHLATLPG